MSNTRTVLTDRDTRYGITFQASQAYPSHRLIQPHASILSRYCSRRLKQRKWSTLFYSVLVPLQRHGRKCQSIGDPAHPRQKRSQHSSPTNKQFPPPATTSLLACDATSDLLTSCRVPYASRPLLFRQLYIYHQDAKRSASQPS
jgi:hypothetical protein